MVSFKDLTSIPGWRTRRKLLILESDDWGSIRMPSRVVFDELLKEGIDLSSDDDFIYNTNDSLETSEDLASLFEVLSSVSDSTGRMAVLTPVAIVANPDFTKIQQSDFSEYFYEPFTDTIKRYQKSDKTFSLWQEGIEKRLFIPQFHGREHLNIKAWIKALKNRNERVIKAFTKEMWGISTANDPGIKIELQAAFDLIDPCDVELHKDIIVSGLNLFEKLFGYRAVYFVPPNGPFNTGLEGTCFYEGIRYLFGSIIQNEPLGNGKNRKKYHWLGQKNKNGITYLTRNCLFEPSQPRKDWVDHCLNDISIAFKWRKPAVISSHRVNYIGALNRDNRKNGLIQLELLLKKIKNFWPDIEFITSAELGEMINNE